MIIKPKSQKWNKIVTDMIVLFVSEEGWEKEVAEVNKDVSGELTRFLKSEQFEAKMGKSIHFTPHTKTLTRNLLIIGTGKQKEVNLAVLRKLAAQAGKQSKEAKRRSVTVLITLPLFYPFATDEVAKTLTEGLILGTYAFEKYKTTHETKDSYPTEAILLTHPSKLQHAINGIKLGEIYSRATCFTRDLVNEPPAVTTPTYLAQIAKSLVKRSEVRVEILDQAGAAKFGMNAYLAVAKGSDEPPKFIRLIYNGGPRKIALIGKAITFDTGGLQIKDAKNMETMKIDMSGAAAVLGVFSVLPQIKPKYTVIGIIPACENMPGPKAFKPGDIVTSLSGKTIEILNTDAEGRVTLADALSYALKEKPEYVVDLATLTGACMVALGEDIAGLFSNNETLKTKITEAAKNEGEEVWPLPLSEIYRESIKSDIADVRNIAKTRYGGAITAALFLEEFVEKIPWAHLDIAGPAYQEKNTALIPKGGSGYGVRMLLDLISHL